MINREPIYAALFGKVAGLVPWGGTYTATTYSVLANSALTTQKPFQLASRRLKSLAQVQVEQQPAIYQVQTRESPQVVRGMPTRWNLKAELWVLVWQPDMEDPVSPLINPIIDAVEAAFAPDNPTVQDCTLGNLVSHCRIQAKDIEIYEGVTNGTTGYQAVVIIPIDIMTA